MAREVWNGLHRMRRSIGFERASEIGFDFFVGGIVLTVELHTDAGSAIALRAFGCDPDNATGDRNFFRLIHQVQQHEHLVADAIRLVGRDE